MKSIIAILIIFLMVTPAQAYLYEGVEEKDIENLEAFTAQGVKVIQFLEDDTTDENEWTQWYTSGHYARDLAKNASLHNISMGSVILGNKKMFRGYDNYIMNYVMIENVMVTINPENDRLLFLDQTPYKYFRLYPDGTQVPSYWRANFAYSGIIYNNYEQ